MPWTAATRSLRTPAIASCVNCCGCGGGDGGGVCWTGVGGRPWPGAVPGAGRVGAESDAVAPAESEAVTPGAEAAEVEELAAAAVVELMGSGGGGGGGGIGGGEDMVETRVPDTKLVGLGFLPALLRRLYGQNSEGWGRGRRLRRVGAVAREEKGGSD